MDKIEVSQRAREAVADYSIKWTGLDEQAANRIKDGLHDPYSLVQAFASFERDILATRTDATPAAWTYVSEHWPLGSLGQPKYKPDDQVRDGWTEVPLYAHPPAPTPATDQADMVDRVARTLAPRLEGGREFDQMPANRRELKIWSRNGMALINDATQEDAIDAAKSAIAAMQGPDVAALVEALKVIQRETTAVTPELENLNMCVGTIHSYVTRVLAPFTEGQP